KGGISYGASDEFSYQAATGQTYCYDLHATILHLLGIDHERLTVRHNGIDRRLTDVHGSVIREVLASGLCGSGVAKFSGGDGADWVNQGPSASPPLNKDVP